MTAQRARGVPYSSLSIRHMNFGTRSRRWNGVGGHLELSEDIDGAILELQDVSAGEVSGGGSEKCFHADVSTAVHRPERLRF